MLSREPLVFHLVVIPCTQSPCTPRCGAHLGMGLGNWKIWVGPTYVQIWGPPDHHVAHKFQQLYIKKKKKSIQQSSPFGWVQTRGFGDYLESPGFVDPRIDHQLASSFQTLLQLADCNNGCTNTVGSNSCLKFCLL